MLKPAIQQPLTKQELKDLVKFLSYHLGYVPIKQPKAIFCKSARAFAQLYESFRVRDPDHIDEINRECNAFFDHTGDADTLVFQGFSYHEGTEIPQFMFPMATVVHELIHFFQYATGTYGSYRILYEGINDLLAGFFTGEYIIDYREEAAFAFNLIMELNGHDFSKTLQWMKTFTVHSNKNRFVHRALKQCIAFSKYNPKKLLTALDSNRFDKIVNTETQAIFTRYSLPQIIRLFQKHRSLIQL
jgi:hypothetical protein